MNQASMARAPGLGLFGGLGLVVKLLLLGEFLCSPFATPNFHVTII